MTLGFLLLLTAGIMNGSFAAPMKRMKGWQWEHCWLMWAIAGLVVVPLAAVLFTVARPFAVYAEAPGRALALIILFGFLWGISAILFGLGVARLGVAIGFAIILGISSALGSIIPLFSKNPGALLETAGQLTLSGVALQVCGVAFCGVANHLRERDRSGGRKAAQLWSGLLICLLSGLGAPLVNLGLVFGSDVTAAAARLGTPSPDAVNAIWPLLFGGAFLTNAGYCAYLINRNGAWKAFRMPAAPRNVLLGASMGLLWMGSNLAYAYGSGRLGPLGLAFGWPMMMGCVVLTANAWGLASGEWRGAGRTARLWMAAGVLALLGGVSLIGIAAAA
jgi:L-rhamnose-H+ transport protein